MAIVFFMIIKKEKYLKNQKLYTNKGYTTFGGYRRCQEFISMIFWKK